LSFDSRERALNGVALGAPFEHLRPLGRASWVSRISEDVDLYYYGLGLVVGVSKDRVSSFEIVFDPARSHRSWHPLTAGRLALKAPDEKWWDLTEATTDTEIFALFGAPFDTGPVGDQPMHSFKVFGVIIDTTHDVHTGTLVSIEIQ
jgi:hypothetical protein